MSDCVNSVVSSMGLVAKVRDGAKVSKRYDRAQTPLERVLASPHISDEIKQALRQRAVTLNPAARWRDPAVTITAPMPCHNHPGSRSGHMGWGR